MNSSVETVNAAAAAIASAESRVQQVTLPQRRRWNSFFRLYWCFGSHRHSKRINHAVLVSTPQQITPQVTAPVPENSSHPPAIAIVQPFIAPPSSPVSFLQSGHPSATQSPADAITLSALSCDMYSPGGRPSIFAIGPYANETQLVSPPVFSTFTTEPSSAPFTPPPETVQFTTPSSPEVPFAKLWTSNSKKSSNPYEFNSYHLISPSSVCSGTSSPFPELVTRRSSNRVNGLLNPITMMDSTRCSQGNEPVLNHRVSFELTAEEVTRCLGRKSIISCETASEFPPVAKISFGREQPETDGSYYSSNDPSQKPRTSITLSTVKEFKFSNSEGKHGGMPASDWWVNEKAVGMPNTPKNNWAFFPLVQTGMS